MTIAAERLPRPVTARWLDRTLDAVGSVRAIAVMRIVLGPITLLHLRPFLRDARAGVAYDDHFWEPYASWLPHVPSTLWFALLWVGAGAAVLMTAGLFTRVATWTAFAAVATNLLASQTHFRHNRTFLTILLLGLALLPSGRVLSLDAVRRRWRGLPTLPDAAPLWPIWLLRAQVCLVYLASGGSKLVDSDWLGGLVLWDRMVRYQHVLDPTPLPAWAIDLLTSRWLYWVIGPAAVFTELFIGLALWFGRTRLTAVWVALVFHAMIELSASVEVFSYAAIAALAIWVTPTARDRVIRIDTAARPGQVMALAVRVGDWFGRFRVEGAPAGSPITVVDRDGSLVRGSAGVWFALTRLPPVFPVAAPVAFYLRRRQAAPA